MGYNTEFRGTIRIVNLDLEKVRGIKKFLGADKRDLVGNFLTKNEADSLEFYHFDVRFNENMDGLEWDDNTEKTYGMLQMLNFLREKFTLEFREGDNMLCQGEDFDDRYMLVVRNNEVVKQEISAPEGAVVCPECEHHFVPGEEV